MDKFTPHHNNSNNKKKNDIHDDSVHLSVETRANTSIISPVNQDPQTQHLYSSHTPIRSTSGPVNLNTAMVLGNQSAADTGQGSNNASGHSIHSKSSGSGGASSRLSDSSISNSRSTTTTQTTATATTGTTSNTTSSGYSRPRSRISDSPEAQFGSIRLPFDICTLIFDFVTNPSDQLSLMLVSDTFLAIGIERIWSRLNFSTLDKWIGMHRTLTFPTPTLVDYSEYIKIMDASCITPLPSDSYLFIFKDVLNRAYGRNIHTLILTGMDMAQDLLIHINQLHEMYSSPSLSRANHLQGSIPPMYSTHGFEGIDRTPLTRFATATSNISMTSSTVPSHALTSADTRMDTVMSIPELSSASLPPLAPIMERETRMEHVSSFSTSGMFSHNVSSSLGTVNPLASSLPSSISDHAGQSHHSGPIESTIHERRQQQHDEAFLAQSLPVNIATTTRAHHTPHFHHPPSLLPIGSVSGSLSRSDIAASLSLASSTSTYPTNNTPSLRFIPPTFAPRLVRLDISNCQMVTPVVLTQALKWMSSLKYLYMSNCPAAEDSALEAISSTSLVELHLCGNPDISDKGILALCGNASDDAHLGNDENKSSGSKVLALEVIEWSMPSSVLLSNVITDTGLVELVTCATQLKRLSFPGLTRVSDTTLQAIAQSCHQLQTLDISHCSQISLKGLQNVVRKCVELNRLNIDGCKRVLRDISSSRSSSSMSMGSGSVGSGSDTTTAVSFSSMSSDQTISGITGSHQQHQHSRQQQPHQSEGYFASRKDILYALGLSGGPYFPPPSYSASHTTATFQFYRQNGGRGSYSGPDTSSTLMSSTLNERPFEGERERRRSSGGYVSYGTSLSIRASRNNNNNTQHGRASPNSTGSGEGVATGTGGASAFSSGGTLQTSPTSPTIPWEEYQEEEDNNT